MVTERQSRNLDVLRAFAVGTVFFGHALLVIMARPSNLIGSAARFGVMAFFVHTALVLMQSLERLDGEGSGYVAARFYIRRLFRIYPLSILCVLIVVAFHIPQLPWRSVVAPTAPVVASNLLLVQNLTGAHSVSSPLWSLPFEVQMYLVLPLCYFARKKWAINPLWLAAIAALACVPFLPLMLTDTLRYFPCFLVGVAAYQFSRNRQGRYPAALLFVLLLVTCALYTFGRAYILNRPNPGLYSVYASDWLCSLAIGLTLPYLREIPEGWVSQAAHQIAKYSYGIYLSHIPIMWVVRVVMGGKPIALRLVVFVVAAVVVPMLAFHLLEAPGIQLGKRLSNRLRRSPGMAISQAA